MNLDELEEKFRSHFPASEVRVKDDVVEFNSSTSSFRVGKDGSVEAEMPLHSFSAEDVDDIVFRDDEVEIQVGEIEYIFRK